MNEKIYEESKILPMIALRGLVVFPKMMLSFDIARKKSIIALNEAMSRNQMIYLTAQKQTDLEDPGADDLYPIGCIGTVKQVVRLGQDGIRVMVEGIQRAKLVDVFRNEPSFVAEVVPVYEYEPVVEENYLQALFRQTHGIFERHAVVGGRIPPEVLKSAAQNRSCGELADFIASNIELDLQYKQQILSEANPVKRLELVDSLLEDENQLLFLERQISEKVHKQMDDNQRDYYLREQMKAISEELGDYDSPQDEATEYREKIAQTALPQPIREKLNKEVDKLFKMPSGSHEGTVVRNYLDTALQLPWGKETKDCVDLVKAK